MNMYEPLHKIRGFCFDVDGVFTDNSIHITEGGQQLRTMTIRDGVAVKQALREGFPVGIITAGSSEGVNLRFDYLGVEFVHNKVRNKPEIFSIFLEKYELKSEEVLYMGDDILDKEILMQVGFPCCPSDADQDIKEICRYISPFRGGGGCVRDIIEKTFRIQGKWQV
jgi:3-deoxy-D-manno-octulosonate 8-phosphate phosphatase (KDO 8-P phosphatase)